MNKFYLLTFTLSTTALLLGILAGICQIIENQTNKHSIREYMDRAKEETYVGNKEKAKEYLLRAKYRCEQKGNRKIRGLGYAPEVTAEIDRLIAGL